MIRVAITGNIAAGKTTVEKLLVKRGYKVFDTDICAHELVQNNAEVIETIKCTFKNHDILDEEGKISREKLGKVVFYDEANRKKIEAILHPYVFKAINNFYSSNSDEKFVFVAIPILFEAGYEKYFDKIVLIYAENELRLERLIKRDKYSEEYARQRMNVQFSQDTKKALCDYVIINNGEPKDLDNQVTEFIKFFSET